MARAKTFTLKLTLGELQAMQLVLEQAAAGASADQVRELEAIDGKVYRLLFPTLAQPGPEQAQLR